MAAAAKWFAQTGVARAERGARVSAKKATGPL